MYIHIYVYKYIYIYLFIYLCIYLSIMCNVSCAYTDICIQIYVYVNVYAYTHIYAHLSIHIFSMYAHIDMGLYTSMYEELREGNSSAHATNLEIPQLQIAFLKPQRPTAFLTESDPLIKGSQTLNCR